MITDVEVYNPVNENEVNPPLVLTIPAYRPIIGSKYVIRNIEGLDPVKSTINLSKYASVDGEVFQGSSVGIRNIVFTIGYRDSYDGRDSLQELRRELYAIFTPTETVELRFKSGDAYTSTMKIFGYVESIETSIFTEDPQVQISVICPDPYFSAVWGVRIEGRVPSTLDMGPLIGTAPSPFAVTLYPTNNVSRVEINNFKDPRIIWEGTIVGGQPFVLSTSRHDKRIEVAFQNRLDGLKQGSLGMKVSKRSSKLSIQVPGGAPMDAVVQYTPRYLGF